MIHVNFVMTTLLNGIWQGTLLAATMWLLLKLLPRLNPTTRFTVLWVTLIAVVALPLAPLASRMFVPRAQTDSPAIACDGQTCAHGCCARYDSAAAVQPAGCDGEPRVESYIDSGTKGSIRICARIGIVASAERCLPRCIGGGDSGASCYPDSLGKVSGHAGDRVDVPVHRDAGAPGIWLPQAAGIKSRRPAASPGMAAAVGTSEQHPWSPPANAIACFRAHRSAHVARISKSGDPDSSNVARYSLERGTRTRGAARTGPPASPR